jgi:hypothetical protein
MSFEVISVSPSSKSTQIRIPNPNPRTSPAGFSGSINANNSGWSGTGRITAGNENRNVFVQGQASGGWSGRPSFGGMVGGQIRF